MFQANAATVYVPCEHEATITAAGPGPLSVAVCTATSSLKRQPALIRPEDVRTKNVGRANWRRTVKDIIDFTFDAGHIVVGETINMPGNVVQSPIITKWQSAVEVKMKRSSLQLQSGARVSGSASLHRHATSMCATQSSTTNRIASEGYQSRWSGSGYQLYSCGSWGSTSRYFARRDTRAFRGLKSLSRSSIHRLQFSTRRTVIGSLLPCGILHSGPRHSPYMLFLIRGRARP